MPRIEPSLLFLLLAACGGRGCGDAEETGQDCCIDSAPGDSAGDSQPDSEPGDSQPDSEPGDSDTGEPAVFDTGPLPEEAQVVLYVETTGSDEDNDCQQVEAPCASLAAAVEQAALLGNDERKQVLLGAGSFPVSGLDIDIPHLTISGSGVDQTELQGPHTGAAGEEPEMLISVRADYVSFEDFTMAGIASDHGAGIGIYAVGVNMQLTVRDVRFEGGLETAGADAAMAIMLDGADLEQPLEAWLRRLQVVGFRGKAGLLVKSGAIDVKVRSSVFYDNLNGIGISNDADPPGEALVSVQNSLFVGNQSGLSVVDELQDPERVSVEYCLFHDSEKEHAARLELGMGVIQDQDPLFRDAPSDFSLQSTESGDAGCSPAIDVGNPASDWQDEPAPNGERINMGHQGNTALASPSCQE